VFIVPEPSVLQQSDSTSILNRFLSTGNSYNEPAMKLLTCIFAGVIVTIASAQSLLNPQKTLSGTATNSGYSANFNLSEPGTAYVIQEGFLGPNASHGRIVGEFRPLRLVTGNWLLETNAYAHAVRAEVNTRNISRFTASLSLPQPAVVKISLSTISNGVATNTFAMPGVFSTSSAGSFEGLLAAGDYIFELSSELDGNILRDATAQATGTVLLQTQLVPEPGTFVALVSGLVVLARRKRRSKR